MNEILSQKYAKNRITQLILFLCLEFGIISKKANLYTLLKFINFSHNEATRTKTLSIKLLNIYYMPKYKY